MALVIRDRVKETTATTGTGDLTLAGATTGYGSFNTFVGTSNTTYYCVVDGSSWEIGLGTLSSSTVLQRTTVLKTSNNDTTRITLAAGVKDVFLVAPSAKLVLTTLTNIWEADQKFRGVKIAVDADDDTYIQSEADEEMGFYCGSSQKMLLDGTNQKLTIRSNDAGASFGPLLELYRDSASPAANDEIGSLIFYGKDSGGTKTDYAYVFSQILAATDTAERGLLSLRVRKDSTIQQAFNVRPDFCYLGTTHALYTAGKTAQSTTTVGSELRTTGQIFAIADSAVPLVTCRLTNDGAVLDVQRDGTVVGGLTVSAGSVTLTASAQGHFSEWAFPRVAKEELGAVVVTTDKVFRHPVHKHLPMVTPCARPSDPRVYGVVAGRTDAGYLLVNGGGAFQALVRGPVEAGQYLETSSEAGVAQVQTDRAHTSSTLGKVQMTDTREDVRLVPAVLYCG